ncbi:hypothetical protein T484DRAFT_1824446 [Baffinella frigidus]|nr:hypothetical protein T484DRAFT_1824446 [Cryptophyta sp. CCMP2293]
MLFALGLNGCGVACSQLRKLHQLPNYAFTPAKSVVVMDKDFNVMKLTDQVRTMVRTDVMVGPHGAGLTHNIFMSDRAFLIEIFIDGSTSLKHFNNLCTWRRGRGNYLSIDNSPNPVKVDMVFAKVVEAINKIDPKTY